MAALMPTWPDIDDLSDAEVALLMRGYRLGLLAGEELAYARLADAPRPVQGLEVEYDAAHGVCACAGCGGAVRVLGRGARTAKVVDGDGREHVCTRQVAAVLERHGVAGMGPILKAQAARPVIAPPRRQAAAAPKPPRSRRSDV